MYTINIKGKSNPKDRKMVKLEMIFFKSGYARVPKVLEVTGLLKDWDAKSQSFRVGSFEATTKNKILFDLRTQYLHILVEIVFTTDSPLCIFIISIFPVV